MKLNKISIINHPILKNQEINLVNPISGEPYNIVAFVGENGCGKTTLLNEIFNYQNSQYIVEKEFAYSFVDKEFVALYLRQGSLHRNAMKEIRKLIDGRDMYPVLSSVNNQINLRANNVYNSKNNGLEILDKLGDKEILNLYKDGHISKAYCSQDVSVKIDGKDHGFNITNYSSGQQELILKLKDLSEAKFNIDCVLLDEPETSLHPRWQKEIVNLMSSLLYDSSGNTPQIFIATHSEKVLESLIKRDDALIIRLFKEQEDICVESIDKMDLRLPITTFAELDYVIFHIPSYEYHDELITTFANQNEVELILDIDKKIKLHPLYDKKELGKIWVSKSKNKVTTFKTLPIYIRNYFHHPIIELEPTEEELIKSIEFLRIIINK